MRAPTCLWIGASRCVDDLARTDIEDAQFATTVTGTELIVAGGSESVRSVMRKAIIVADEAAGFGADQVDRMVGNPPTFN